MKTAISVVVVLLSFFLLAGGVGAQSSERLVEAEVVSVVDEGELISESSRAPFQVLELRTAEGELLELTNGGVPAADAHTYKVGDRVMLSETQVFDESAFAIVDYVRRDGLYVLFGLFALLAVIIGGRWGVASILGMGFSFFVIFSFILPRILSGANPVVVAVLGAALIVPITFYLSHGIQMKTHLAVVGTVVTLIITGLLAETFVNITHLTGFASEEAGFLSSQTEGSVDMKGLLLAGIIISTLGVLDDITVSQASIVRELKRANKKLSFVELFRRAMVVGRDHVASLINTLVLVYAGASLPLLLLFTTSGLSLSQVINFEIVADEIVRTLIGSIGLILAVPITTALAGTAFEKRSA